MGACLRFVLIIFLSRWAMIEEMLSMEEEEWTMIIAGDEEEEEVVDEED